MTKLGAAIVDGVRELDEPRLDLTEGHEVVGLVEAQDPRPARGVMDDGMQGEELALPERQLVEREIVGLAPAPRAQRRDELLGCAPRRDEPEELEAVDDLDHVRLDRVHRLGLLGGQPLVP